MYTLNCRGKLLMIDKPVVMGIINATPDSFYAASRQQNADAFLRKAETMIADGATILDIGGQSTRPGSEVVGVQEELKRVIEPIEALCQNFPDIFISIDTYYAAVAKEAVQAGASIVNDISAGSMDEAMLSTVSKLNTPYVLMHMKGTPQTMQQTPGYDDVTKTVLDFFIQKVSEKRSGIIFNC